jgi:hypothetical protein
MQTSREQLRRNRPEAHGVSGDGGRLDTKVRHGRIFA